jgi:hypothetical protein
MQTTGARAEMLVAAQPKNKSNNIAGVLVLIQNLPYE